MMKICGVVVAVALMTLGMTAGLSFAQEPPPPEPIVANVEVYPQTLNLRSQGKFVTVLIELPEGFDVANIDVSSIVLTAPGGALSPLPRPTEIGDPDEDGIIELMVKFSRPALKQLVAVGDVEIAVSGELTDATPFDGSDTIKVKNPGKGKGKQ